MTEREQAATIALPTWYAKVSRSGHGENGAQSSRGTERVGALTIWHGGRSCETHGARAGNYQHCNASQQAFFKIMAACKHIKQQR